MYLCICLDIRADMEAETKALDEPVSSMEPLLDGFGVSLSHWRGLDISSYCKSSTARLSSRAKFTDEVTVAGAELPGDDEMRRAAWIRVESVPSAPSPEVSAACAGLGAGERSVIHLASALAAGLVLIDEERARRAARRINAAGSIAVLERGARLGRVDGLLICGPYT
jgi:hypothetical protein